MTSTRRHLIIYGAGGHAVSVASAAMAAGFEIRAFLCDEPEVTELHGIPVLQTQLIPNAIDTFQIIVAVGLNFSRGHVTQELRSAFPGINFATVIHPTASIGLGVEIGANSAVLQNATLGAWSKVGFGCIVNSGAVLDHQSHLQDFASLAPGVTVGGNVSIGVESAVSIGATVSHGVRIGDHAIVGGHSFVYHDVPELSVVFGSPARLIRGRERGDRYL